MRGRWCVQKLLQESKNVEYESEENEGTRVRENDIPQPHPTNRADKLPTRRSGVHFTCEEDKYLRLGIGKFGLRWTKILRHSDFHFKAGFPVANIFARSDFFPLSLSFRLKPSGTN